MSLRSLCYICEETAKINTDYIRKEAHLCENHYNKIIDIFSFCFDFETNSTKPNLLSFCRSSYKKNVFAEVVTILRSFFEKYKNSIISKEPSINCETCPDSLFRYRPRYVEKEDGSMQVMCRHKARETKTTHYCCIECNNRYIIQKVSLFDSLQQFPVELVGITESYNDKNICHNCENQKECISDIRKLL